ncbi:cell filamentation protein Fic [Tissierella creatinini]|nr:cell filamentation protein Fic [Tissierella creatinini]TJX63583.1 cell filamentation protein Fic [Soehngenia saccharolytica]
MNEIQFLMYDSDEKVEVLVQEETIWATQKAISKLFDIGVPAISKHLKNIFQSGELDEKVVVSILENTTQHGAIEGKTQTKSVKYYNLDAIISIGYRVNSQKAIEEYKEFNKHQKIVSDFDKEIKKIQGEQK